MASGEDKMCWILVKKKGFKVSGFYQVFLNANVQSFPWRSIWKSKIPSRVAFIVWTAALGKFLTTDNFQKRHVWILDWFYMWKCNEESVDHLLLHCPTATDLWSMMFGLFGVCWVILKTVVELLACWQGRFRHHQNGPSLLDMVYLDIFPS